MYKVMVVDDDSRVYRVVSMAIPWEAYDMKVEAYAPNGEKAIEYLQENTADVVLVDLSMPHMGELEFIKRVCEFLPRTVFVILSAHSEYRLVKESFCTGAFDYLLKVDVDDEEVVDALLRRVKKRLQGLEKEKERPFDFGDLISKLNVDKKDTFRYLVQVFQTEEKNGRLKLEEKLHMAAKENRMVYGCYDGYITVLYYGKEDPALHQQRISVHRLLEESACEVEKSGNSSCGTYTEIEELYMEAVRNADDGFGRIQKYFKENYSRSELSIQIVMDELNISRRDLSKCISEHTGMLFKSYLNEIRIEAAKEMLLKTNMRVQEIAYAAGYVNVEHFTRTFAEKTGCSPSRYASRKGENHDKRNLVHASQPSGCGLYTSPADASGITEGLPGSDPGSD